MNSPILSLVLNRQKLWRSMLAVAIMALFFSACSSAPETPSLTEQKKIAVLMVNHGSRSESWRNTLLALETSIKSTVVGKGNVQEMKTAFMEYTEPSIATRLKEFDKEGFTDVIIVPIFLTVSPHSFDDIPTIVGLKENPQSIEMLKLEKIERYTPKATVHIAPLFDFTDILQKNILRRFQELSRDPSNEGLVMIAYGDETYSKEWSDLLSRTGRYVSEQTGIHSFSYGWCGHIVRYSPDSTTQAIHRVLNEKETAVVIPVLVAVDEMFQVKIIGDGIAKTGNKKDRIRYKPDAILPDANIEKWAVDIIAEYTDKITGATQTVF